MIFDTWHMCQFQLYSKEIHVSGTPCPWSHFWRKLMVLYGTIEWLGHSWHHGTQLYCILKCYAYLQFSNINQSLSRTTCHLSPSWRMLMVPDWILRTWGHYWLHGSPLYVNLWLMLIFSSLAWIVCQEQPVLEFIFWES